MPMATFLLHLHAPVTPCALEKPIWLRCFIFGACFADGSATLFFMFCPWGRGVFDGTRFVLYKEKNMLMSQVVLSRRSKVPIPAGDRRQKVRVWRTSCCLSLILFRFYSPCLSWREGRRPFTRAPVRACRGWSCFVVLPLLLMPIENMVPLCDRRLYRKCLPRSVWEARVPTNRRPCTVGQNSRTPRVIIATTFVLHGWLRARPSVGTNTRYP